MAKIWCLGLKPSRMLAFAMPLVIAAPVPAATLTVLSSGLAYPPEIGAVLGTTAYGNTSSGGQFGYGTVFEITSAGRYTTIHDFSGGADGSHPNEMLAIDPAGTLYGTTQTGGAYSGGTVFALSTSGKLRTLHAFGKTGDGKQPLQGVVRGNRGMLYGSAASGMIDTNGSVFKISPAGTYWTLHKFISGPDGHCPYSGVAVDSAGNVYGTSVGHGFGGDPQGSIWKRTPDGQLTTLYSFKNGNDGEWPDQAPILDSKGNLYGTVDTRNGQQYPGAVWKVDTKGNFSIVHQFSGGTDGYGPNGVLLLNSDGNIYGTTPTGGGTAANRGYGTLFRITPAGAFKVMHTFRGNADGSGPTGTLAHDRSGAIYGGTYAGTIYKFRP